MDPWNSLAAVFEKDNTKEEDNECGWIGVGRDKKESGVKLVFVEHSSPKLFLSYSKSKLNRGKLCLVPDRVGPRQKKNTETGPTD